MDNNKLSRRNFLGTTATAAAAFTVIPNIALGSVLGHRAPSDKLNVAVVPPSGRAASMMNAAATQENIVALCDIDSQRANQAFQRFPNARRYSDYRRMFDEMRNSIDAVIVGTPDHTHAVIAAQAITLGKHVYVEKPLTHSVYESRLLTKLAAHHKVATQMGNQGASQAGVRQICDWIADGQIGDVTKVECATNRPIWMQGLNPPDPHWVPEHVNWDAWIGPAKMTPYNRIYHWFGWRGWWEFGTGALGDMACHIMHPVFKALKLGYPTKVQGSSSALLTDCAPVSQKVKMTFPARPQFNVRNRINYPEVEIVWTDGGILPEYPAGWPDGRIWDNGLEGPVIFHGTRDKLICGCYGRNPWLLSGRTPTSPRTQREILPAPEMPPLQEGGRPFRPEIHTIDWLRACKESPENRVEASSHFGEAGPFNEMVVMGVLAVRLQGLNRELQWDGPNMRFTNIGDNDEIRWLTALGEGMSRTQGPVRNAKATAEELIKRTYREGWSLPPMPA